MCGGCRLQICKNTIKREGRPKKGQDFNRVFLWSSAGHSCADGLLDVRLEPGQLHGWIHRKRKSCRIWGCHRRLTAAVSGKRSMNYDMTVQPEVTLPQIRYQIWTHMKVSDIIIESIRFIGIFSFFVLSLKYIRKKKRFQPLCNTIYLYLSW